MLLPSRLTFLILLSSVFICRGVSAGLYGFTTANPYTRDELILDLEVAPKQIINYREKMRDNVIMLADYAKERHPKFEVIIHEGTDLLEKGLWEYHLDGYNEAQRSGLNAADPTFLAKLKEQVPERQNIGTSARRYSKILDGIVLNNYFCSPDTVSAPKNLKLISLDKCNSEEAFDEAIQDSVGRNALLYAFTNDKYAFKNTKNQIIINENARNIASVKEAQNIDFILDTSLYPDKFAFIEDLRNSNFDIIVIPAFFAGKPFSSEEIHSLKFKKNGTRRRIFAVYNISETNDNQYYWKPGWKINNPQWLKRLSFVDKENIITEYWHPQWKKIIANYFKGIVDIGFDGAFLTGLENYKYFEKQTPLE